MFLRSKTCNKSMSDLQDSSRAFKDVRSAPMTFRLHRVQLFRLLTFLVSGLLLQAMPHAAAARQNSAGKLDFNRDIRPILSENCLTCHGPDPNKRKAGLRLDVRTNAIAQ